MSEKAIEKPVRQITDLNDFAPEGDVMVRLEFDDHIEEVPMRALSYSDYLRLGWEVPNPLPRAVGGNAKETIYDTKDPAYLRAMEEANLKRDHRRLLASLRLDVPGETEDEKIAFLTALDAARLRMLIGAMQQLAFRGVARIEAKPQFPNGHGSAAGKSLRKAGLASR